MGVEIIIQVNLAGGIRLEGHLSAPHPQIAACEGVAPERIGRFLTRWTAALAEGNGGDRGPRREIEEGSSSLVGTEIGGELVLGSCGVRAARHRRGELFGGYGWGRQVLGGRVGVEDPAGLEGVPGEELRVGSGDRLVA